MLLGLAILLVVGAGYFGYQYVAEQRALELHEAQKAQEAKEMQEQVADQERAAQARQAAITQIHFQSDPQNKLPVYQLNELVARMWDRRNPLHLFEGARLRIRLSLTQDDLFERSIHLMSSPEQFVYDYYDFEFDEPLDKFNPRDEVEIVATYEGRDKNSGPDPSMTERFHGEEIQKLP